MAQADAWLCDLGSAGYIALGQREILQVSNDLNRHELALAPAYLKHIVFWQNRPLAVMNLGLRLGMNATATHCLAIIAYFDPARQTHQFAALDLARPPEKIKVDDGWASQDIASIWLNLVRSGFSWQQQSIPIIDLTKLFTMPQKLPQLKLVDCS